ncbi:hypothetical protein [Candidatus Epulonipiscium viviparus]|uniref:hypothetical protein n=1 Tax=Candidatus Epulonipiscium viviparus TaxID=420336 RepID=UPI0027381318|nr:hypothetical protein [Candidatus Epulopiscium viviparus]
MNKYDEVYDIRLATADDQAAIMQFIDNYWKKGHILGSNEILFEYEFREGNKINAVLAIKKSTNSLEGILCFLNCAKGGASPDLWGSLWKVKDERENMPFLGIELGKRILSLTGAENHLGSGLNINTTVPIRERLFKDQCAKMRHFYMLNPEMVDFKIASIENLASTTISTGATLVPLHSASDFVAAFDIAKHPQIPRKDAAYIEYRYYNHPIYKYQVFAIKPTGAMPTDAANAVVIIRAIQVEDRAILRIVDFLGDQKLFAMVGANLAQLLIAGNYEYIDFYEHGFTAEYILAAGFVERLANDANIIPNYFEPFLKRNIDIWVHYKPDETLFFKADSDQDRPSIV